MTSNGYGGHSMVAPLRRVMVRRPDPAFGAADPDRWHYASRPDFGIALAEHAGLVATIAASGAEVLYHDEPLADHADAIFVPTRSSSTIRCW
jgi:arginine deiminase